ncbi:thioredoxin [Reticulomyxa filosa]|uniref:Thioredoxin n=1 Tax=Reticulomyxa filosa TaxID=46433 RepID=X6LL69_RETFI|nr:thioredoxin [Reticulomyxa filosa]|eukprot:ETO01460.1 thioredoxin [Reticulomyxa filosa]
MGCNQSHDSEDANTTQKGAGNQSIDSNKEEVENEQEKVGEVIEEVIEEEYEIPQTGKMNVVTSDNHFEYLLQYGKEHNLTIVADFFDLYCGPCKLIAPYYEQLAPIYNDILFIKVDIDKANETTQKMELDSLPTFAAFENGAELTTVKTRLKMAEEQKLKDFCDLFKSLLFYIIVKIVEIRKRKLTLIVFHLFKRLKYLLSHKKTVLKRKKIEN